jgi:hypothetical protein
MPSPGRLQPPATAGDATVGARVHLLNVVFIAGAIVVLFWRVFLLGNTLIDVATLNNQLPWGYYAGDRSDYPYDRRDPTDMYVTRDYFVVQSYRDGELPLWNPYTMAGHPIYADGVTRLFSPALLFYTFLDVPLGYTVGRLFELCCGAIFLYWLLVAFGVRAPAALLGALVFAFSSHSMLHLVGLGWWGGLMWMPLILLLVDRAISRSSLACATLAGMALAAQIYCGYMANEIYYIGATVLYYLFFAFRGRQDVPDRARHRKPIANFTTPAANLKMMAVTLIVGFCLSGPVWIPVLEQLKYSNRLIVPTQISYIYLPPWYLATLVFPSILGAPYDARFLTLFQAVNVSHDHTLYMGIAALAMLGFCVFWAKRSRTRSISPSAPSAADLNDQLPGDSPDPRSATGPSFGYDRLVFFAALSVLAVLIITTAPVYVHITRFIPVLQTIRVIMRAGVLLVFSASVLVAFGCQLLLDAPRAMILDYFRLTRRILYLLAGSVVAAVVGAYAIRAAGLQTSQQGKGKLAFFKKALGLISTGFTPPGHEIIIPLALSAIVVLLLYLTASRRLSRRGLYAAIVALLVADLFWNSRNFEHEYDRSGVYPRTEITDRLASLPPGRVLPVPADIGMNRHIDAITSRSKIITPPNTLLPYRLATVTGKDQIFPKWYHDFATLIEPQPEMSHVVFDRNQSVFFDLIGVQYVLTHALDPAPQGMDHIETTEDVALYNNPTAQRRAFFAKQIEVVAGETEALAKMREPGFDPATTVVLEAPIGSLAAETSHETNASAGTTSANDKTPAPAASVIEDKRNTVQIATDSKTGGILFLSDTYYPGWQAEIDGVPATIFKADVAFRAVSVPPGGHVVKFVFAPKLLRLSVYGAGAGLLIAIAGLTFGRKRPHAE